MKMKIFFYAFCQYSLNNEIKPFMIFKYLSTTNAKFYVADLKNGIFC